MSLSEIRNLDYAILLCENVAKMRDFYRDILGFTVDEIDDSEQRPEETWVQFRIGSTLFGLRPRGRGYDGSHVGDGASVQLSFRVTPGGVISAHQELLEKSVAILEPPTDQAFGHRTLYFKDPEDNVIEIYADI